MVLIIPSRLEFCYMALLRIGVNAVLLLSSRKPIEEVISVISRYDCHGIILCLGTEKCFNDQLMGFLKTRKEKNKIVLIDSEKTDAFVGEEFSNLRYNQINRLFFAIFFPLINLHSIVGFRIALRPSLTAAIEHARLVLTVNIRFFNFWR